MFATFEINGVPRRIDCSAPIDISVPMIFAEASEQWHHPPNALQTGGNPNAFFVGEPLYKPYQAGQFIGSVAAGGACNCETLLLTPHGNGTHTECIGHITPKRIALHDCLQRFFFSAELVSVIPERLSGGDSIINRKQLEQAVRGAPEALVVRTLPNTIDKKHFRYSGTNPPFFAADAALFLVERGVRHLMTDLPSLDREDDSGVLAAHHIFWQYGLHAKGLAGFKVDTTSTTARFDATITEMVFVPDNVPDGEYLLSLHITSLLTDASPSKPVLYRW